MQPHLTTMAIATLSQQAQINVQAHLQRLQDYVEKMAPKRPISTVEGAGMQRMLWQSIKQMLQRDGNEFIHHYSETLRIINENRNGCFHPRYLFRFLQEVNMPANDRSNFERVLNLMLRTCDPATRSITMRQVDMRSSLAGLDDRQREKVAAYYAL